MANMRRIRYLLTNFTGEPGYTSFYTDDVPVDSSFFNTFWNSVYALFPGGLTIHSPDFTDVMDIATGTIVGEQPYLTQADLVSPSPAAPFAGMAGAFIDWSCGAARIHGRAVRGRTFLVPLENAAFGNNGKLLPTTVTSIHDAATALIASTTEHLSVWARPFAGRGIIVRPGKRDLPAIPARPGTLNPISAAAVPSMQATLRSRRT